MYRVAVLCEGNESKFHELLQERNGGIFYQDGNLNTTKQQAGHFGRLIHTKATETISKTHATGANGSVSAPALARLTRQARRL